MKSKIFKISVIDFAKYVAEMVQIDIQDKGNLVSQYKVEVGFAKSR